MSDDAAITLQPTPAPVLLSVENDSGFGKVTTPAIIIDGQTYRAGYGGNVVIAGETINISQQGMITATITTDVDNSLVDPITHTVMVAPQGPRFDSYGIWVDRKPQNLIPVTGAPKAAVTDVASTSPAATGQPTTIPTQPGTTPSTKASNFSYVQNSGFISPTSAISTSPALSSTTRAASSRNQVTIGVGVGVGIAFGITMIGAICFLLRRRRLRGKKTAPKEDIHQNPTYFDGKGEMDAGLECLAPQELPGSERNEPQELAASESRRPQEVVGSDWNARELITSQNTHEMG